jgi:uncharacterized protein
MIYYIYKDSQGDWRWYLNASNGKKIANGGEGYRNKQDCLHAISLVKQSAQSPIHKL